MIEDAFAELKLLADEAEKLLEAEGEFYTERNKVAILDIIEDAKVYNYYS